MKEGCRNCYWWKPIQTSTWQSIQRNDYSQGKCIRFPPTVNIIEEVVEVEQGCNRRQVNLRTTFPVTRYDEYCGEFKEMESE